jgi:hypothetical protein
MRKRTFGLRAPSSGITALSEEGVMGQLTEGFVLLMLTHGEHGEHTALTVWEEQQLARAWLQLNAVRQIVNTQALDEGLWFRAQTAAEAYLQQALRRLAAAVEEGQAK